MMIYCPQLSVSTAPRIILTHLHTYYSELIYRLILEVPSAPTAALDMRDSDDDISIKTLRRRVVEARRVWNQAFQRNNFALDKVSLFQAESKIFTVKEIR
ncbi:hypothetical protein EJB05_23719, partial [Eragrostis curvula]